MSDKIKEYLGGFQQAAQTLTHIAGRTFTRQGIQQFWRRGDVNGFPEREARSINGHVRLLLDMQELADWYAFVEAAAVLSSVAGKLYNSADVYALWINRNVTGFPDKRRIAVIDWPEPDMGPIRRRAFNLDAVAQWYRTRITDERIAREAEYSRRAAC